MRFEFLGKDNCPEWVLAEIQLVNRISSIKMKLILNQIVKKIIGNGTFEVKQKASGRKSDSPKKRKGSDSAEQNRRIDSDFDDMDAAMEAKMNAKVKDMGQLIKEAKRKLKAKQSEPVLKKRKHESDTDD